MNIRAVTVKKHVKHPTEPEIIKRISGKDKTPGSCASIAYAYIANKCGLDVLDFRGGDSQELFQCPEIFDEILNLPGIKGKKFKVGKQGAVKKRFCIFFTAPFACKL